MADPVFRTVGVDLASQDNRTALAEIGWDGPHAVLLGVRMGVSNDAIVAAAQGVSLIGIDCPLGWPKPFTDFVIACRDGTVSPDAATDDAAKQSLAYRRTDFVVRAQTGRWPLSVSADRIAYPAMRCAGLLARLSAAGHPVQRTGINSIVAEVYPAAALRIWGLDKAGFKASTDALGALVDQLVDRTRWLDWGGFERICKEQHDAVDAVVCAIVAGAVRLGLTNSPGNGDLLLANEEGWIHLPDATFLRDGPARTRMRG